MSPRSILQFGAKLLLIRRKIVFEADLDEIKRIESRIPAVYRQANREDFLLLSDGEHDYDPSAWDFAIERLGAGDQLTIAEYENQVVFYGWLMFGQLDMGLRRYLPLDPDAAYLYKLFTVAAQRGKRLAPRYFSFLSDHLRPRNIRRVVSWVEARNHASRRVFESAGFRTIGCIWHIQFFFRTHCFASPALRARLRNDPSGPSSSMVSRAGLNI